MSKRSKFDDAESTEPETVDEPLEPEPGTVKEIEQDLEPVAPTQTTDIGDFTVNVKANLTTGEILDVACPELGQVTYLKRFAVRLHGHGTLLIDATDAEAAKAEYNRQCGIVKSDHAYTVEPVTEG